MEKLLDIMFHHGGTFKKNVDRKLVYSPDNRACLGDLDEDTLNVFFVRNYFKELGYDKVVECWWLIPKRSLEVGLRDLTTDDELREMCFYAQKNDGVVDVYFEHGVSTPELIEGKEAVLPIHEDTKSMADHENPKLHHIPNPKSTTKPNTTLTVKQNQKPKQNQKLKKTQPKPKPNPKFNPPKRITRSQGRGHWSANKGKQTFHVDLTANRSSSDEGSSEDDSYVPMQEASSSSDDELVTEPIRKEVKKVHKALAMAKGKEKMYKDTIMQDDDANAADLSDVEVDLGFLESPGDRLMYDALDPGAESDGLQTELDWQVSWSKRLESTQISSNVRLQHTLSQIPIWTGDEAYEKFEVHGQPTNMVVDLGKRLCTCQFWMLTGISCVHACAALARVNKRPEDFCHPLVIMDSYRKSYEHYINPLPGQSMWEKSAYRKLTTKRRKDVDEGTSVNKKAKQSVTLKRQLKPFTCTYYGAPPPTTTSPPKLPTKWRTSPQPVTTSVDPIQGASAATSSRMARFMKFVPTPQFKAPRKKNP
ncbi:hypothetical protein Ahy_A01g004057 [Arachis hypogaea]|uniref:SWIM-type domain-containing protein n=1 Tax=Arachis hypogaea TaxID=3818 RepID=A0A445EV66_ARAHY|nr:hypothetical protein Ahy_A01g004057 [Arachis hypogaea]